MDAETESQSVLSGVALTPLKAASSNRLTLKSTEKSMRISQINFSEENADPNSTVISEVKHVDSKGETALETMIEQDEASFEQHEEIQDAADPFATFEDNSAGKLQRAMEIIEHLKHENLTLKKSVEIVIKNQEKERKLMNQELADQRRRAQKAEDEKNAAFMEHKKQQSKIDAKHLSELNRLKAELNQSKTASSSGPNASFASGRSFSQRLFMSGKSQKLQAKVQSNVNERDHARRIKTLVDENERYQSEVAKMSIALQQYIELCAEHTTSSAIMRQENDALRARGDKYKQRMTRAITLLRKEKAENETLVFQAGCVAQDVVQLTAELEYERQKHVKQSRLAVLKQTEELKRLKEELEVLRSNPHFKEVVSASVKKTTQKRDREPVPVEPVQETEAYVPVMTGAVTDNGTLAEMIAGKAFQMSQTRAKKGADVMPARNKSSAAVTPFLPPNMTDLVANAMEKRRIQMMGDDDMKLDGSDSEDSFDY